MIPKALLLESAFKIIIYLFIIIIILKWVLNKQNSFRRSLVPKSQQKIFLKNITSYSKVYKIRPRKFISRHLLFRDSSHTLPANRLRVYHLPQKRHLSFRNSSHTLFADRLRVYHSPKKKYGQPKLCKICYKEKYTHSFKKKTKQVVLSSTRHFRRSRQNSRKKWAKQLTPSKRSALFTFSKFG